VSGRVPEVYKDVSSPTGAFRAVARLPVHLHRWGLGWMTGSRVLILTHTGRKSGLPRQVALEVVDHDARSGSFLIASGYGRRAQWYRNIEHTPAVGIRVARRRYAAVAEPLSPDASGRAMAEYAGRHPRIARRLMRLCGLTVDGTPEDWFAVGRDHVPFVRLRVRQDAGG
jgi:deazaflavin-dependent oxidoreductase (nitroreductase family)